MANNNGTYKNTSNGNGRRLMPRTAIEWITLFTLFSGIVASLYSSILKPYYHIVALERNVTEIKRDIVEIRKELGELEKSTDRIRDYIYGR